MAIAFFSRNTDFKLSRPRKTAAWIRKIISREKFLVENLNFIFCDDEFLLAINQQYLDHDTYTDIVTFDNSEKEGELEGDIFVSVDRVRENAGRFSFAFEDELDRVMIHGVLHLMGFSDKTTAQKKEMRKKEDACLSLR